MTSAASESRRRSCLQAAACAGLLSLAGLTAGGLGAGGMLAFSALRPACASGLPVIDAAALTETLSEWMETVEQWYTEAEQWVTDHYEDLMRYYELVKQSEYMMEAKDYYEFAKDLWDYGTAAYAAYDRLVSYYDQYVGLFSNTVDWITENIGDTDYWVQCFKTDCDPWGRFVQLKQGAITLADRAATLGAALRNISLDHVEVVDTVGVKLAVDGVLGGENTNKYIAQLNMRVAKLMDINNQIQSQLLELQATLAAEQKRLELVRQQGNDAVRGVSVDIVSSPLKFKSL